MQRIKGFTLIELIAVMVLIAIIAAFVTIRLPSSSTFSLSSVTEQLRRDLRYTQTLAMSLNASYMIGLSSNSYTITPSPPAGVYPVKMPSGVTLSAVNITFSPSGSPGASAITIIITAAGIGANTLSVSAETGFING